MGTTGRLLDVATAATYLGLSEPALRTMIQRRQIPFVRVGARGIRFDRRQLDRWIDDNTVEAS